MHGDRAVTLKIGCETCPRVGPVPEGIHRPYWSVMIPAYNPSSLLEKALQSVLDQDPGPEEMQIAVVDDHSPSGEAERIVNRVAPGRVEFHRQPANVGLAGNWNGSIERARGRWVHLLHQDDHVLPGFYERLKQAGYGGSKAGAAFCRHYMSDAEGNWEHLSNLEQPDPGVLDGWLGRISRMQLIQCASIVVRREVYELVGGYRADLSLALDWEMWVRIATCFPVWYEPEILARWLVHRGNESSRLEEAGDDIPDVFRAIEVIEGHLPAELKASAGDLLLKSYRDREIVATYRLFNEGNYRSGMVRFGMACRCDPTLKFSPINFRFRKWAAKLWLKSLFTGTKSGSLTDAINRIDS
ncbi:glycosyltransferase family 2 protein (plasmid) [Tundrisphaera lichenicola]|uniref:glycosyltransferase family 2 protein n=1 Tax=Tundrisphaera lichenicola TaxID=2029860 RepID=UPI003EB70883